MTLAAADDLDILGLAPGDPVRWRAASGTRWHNGRVSKRERDGSIGVVDSRGASRSFAVERLEVPCPGPRGGTGWEPLADRVSRSEQLRLL